ncbi:hypothetical protein [Streptomyces niveus]|uniref:hypothetical protein n=1 Tax=Streptomyces niveus TaxID=193462 RepID=UPI00341B57BB
MIGGVVGYTYGAENLCPRCTLKAMLANAIKVRWDLPHEEAIRRAAENEGVNFDDERSYDSGDFPKAVTEQMCETELTELPDGESGVISDERCTGVKCGKWLVLGEKSPSLAALTRWVRVEHELPQALAKKAAATLREWGLSHPEFIDSDNVKEAVAQHPHAWIDYRFVDYPNSTETRAIHEPDDTGDECLHCGQAWQAQQHQTA